MAARAILCDLKQQSSTLSKKDSPPIPKLRTPDSSLSSVKIVLQPRLCTLRSYGATRDGIAKARRDSPESPFFASLADYIDSSRKSHDFEILSGRLAMIMPPRRSVVSEAPTEMSGADMFKALGELTRVMQFQQKEIQRMENKKKEPKAGEILKDFKRFSPPVFKGLPDHMEAEKWISQIEKIFKGMQCPDSEKVNLATFVLEGEADFWWKAAQETLDDDEWSWDLFKKKFYEKFFPISVRDGLTVEFLTLEQGDMTVAQYAAKFDELSRFASHMVSTEDLKARKFERGLKIGILNKLALLRCPTYAEVLEKALIAERVYLSSKKENIRKDMKKGKGRQFQSHDGMNKKQKHATPPGGLVPGSFKGRCNKCHEWGHISKNCPKNVGHQKGVTAAPQAQRTFAPVAPIAATPTNVKCFKCGKMGHYANKCTQQPQQQQKPRDQGPRQPVQGRVYALTRGDAVAPTDVVEGGDRADQETFGYQAA